MRSRRSERALRHDRGPARLPRAPPPERRESLPRAHHSIACWTCASKNGCMPLLAQYRSQARYNRWMNDKLYAATATLDDSERRRDRGAFFGSILGTLNHLLLTDRIWMLRFRHGSGSASAHTMRTDSRSRSRACRSSSIRTSSTYAASGHAPTWTSWHGPKSYETRTSSVRSSTPTWPASRSGTWRGGRTGTCSITRRIIEDRSLRYWFRQVWTRPYGSDRAVALGMSAHRSDQSDGRVRFQVSCGPLCACVLCSRMPFTRPLHFLCFFLSLAVLARL